MLVKYHAQELKLKYAPQILFLFGLSGSGKSYVGELIAELASWHVYHADQDITQAMKLALAEQRPFTPKMRDEYFLLVAERMLTLRQRHKRIVVTQAVYKQKHRDQLMKQVPDMEMICIEASDQQIFQWLNCRDQGISGASAAALRMDFEPALKGTKIIHNQGDRAQIITQLNRYYAQPTKP
jgi:gluconokinase